MCIYIYTYICIYTHKQIQYMSFSEGIMCDKAIPPNWEGYFMCRISTMLRSRGWSACLIVRTSAEKAYGILAALSRKWMHCPQKIVAGDQPFQLVQDLWVWFSMFCVLPSPNAPLPNPKNTTPGKPSNLRLATYFSWLYSILSLGTERHPQRLLPWDPPNLEKSSSSNAEPLSDEPRKQLSFRAWEGKGVYETLQTVINRWHQWHRWHPNPPKPLPQRGSSHAHQLLALF